MHTTASFRLNPRHISSSWVERSLHAEFQFGRLPGSGSFMVGDRKQQQQNNLVEAEAEVWAVAKADQYK